MPASPTENLLQSSKSTGESHLWTAGSAKVAVDLGNYAASGAEVGNFAPDILVLTHSDADHIGERNGEIPSQSAHALFVSLPPGHAWELWVPYEWEALLQAAERYALGDVANERDDDGDDAELDALQLHRRLMAGEWNRVDDDGQPSDLLEIRGTADLTERDWSRAEERLGEDLPQTRLATDLQDGRLGRLEFPHLRPDLELGEQDWKSIAKDVFSKREKLDYVLSTAASLGACVRYFSVDHTRDTAPWQTSGTPGVVTIVSGVEVEPVSPILRSASASMLLARTTLTTQNKRALVTYLHGAQGNGALIWSDTDGSFCELKDPQWVPWKEVGVMTAPHHASHKPVHSPIWEARNRYEPNLCVVKAGGHSNQVPSPEFLRVPTADRGCTKCQDLACGRCTAKRRVGVSLSIDGSVSIDGACHQGLG